MRYLKPFGLRSKEGKKLKISLSKDGALPFEQRVNASISKAFFSEPATDLMNKVTNCTSTLNTAMMMYLTMRKNKYQLHNVSEEY